MEELKRLESIMLQIDFAKNDESRFEEMYELMQIEFPNVDIGGTMLKEARIYMGEKKKRPRDKKGNSYNYLLFINDFKSFVFDKIHREKNSGQHPH